MPDTGSSNPEGLTAAAAGVVGGIAIGVEVAVALLIAGDGVSGLSVCGGHRVGGADHAATPPPIAAAGDRNDGEL